jgi:hypothetical protein
MDPQKLFATATVRQLNASDLTRLKDFEAPDAVWTISATARRKSVLRV